MEVENAPGVFVGGEDSLRRLVLRAAAFLAARGGTWSLAVGPQSSDGSPGEGPASSHGPTGEPRDQRCSPGRGKRPPL